MDKELIKQRKHKYGDNFTRIAQLWTNYVGGKIKFTPIDVAKMMALMKIARLEFMKTSGIKDTKDTETDLENYNWIAENYDEYRAL